MFFLLLQTSGATIDAILVSLTALTSVAPNASSVALFIAGVDTISMTASNSAAVVLSNLFRATVYQQQQALLALPITAQVFKISLFIVIVVLFSFYNCFHIHPNSDPFIRRPSFAHKYLDGT